MEDKIFSAIRFGKLSDVFFCLRNGIDPNTYIRRNLDYKEVSMTLLGWATEYNRPQIVTTLLQHKADVHQKYCTMTPLEHATHKMMEEYQLRDEGYVSGSYYHEDRSRDKDKNLEIIKTLVDRGAEVNDERVASNLIEANNVKALEFLLQNGMNINKTYDGKTALIFAVEKRDFEMVKWLLAHGAKFSIPSALCSAIEVGSFKIVQLFLKSTVDVNFEFKNGSLLTRAISSGNLDIVKELIKHGAHINFSLVQSVTMGDLDIVGCLLENGADPNREDDDGNLPVTTAIQESHLEILKKLVEHGAATNLNDLTLAVRLKEKEISKFLMSTSITSDDYSSFLFDCINHKNVDGVDFVLGLETNLEICDSDGFTPLTKSVQLDHFVMVKKLVEKGAKIDQVDRNGNCALVLAATKLNFQIVDLLVSCGCCINGKLEEVADKSEDFAYYLKSLKAKSKRDCECVICLN